MWRRWTSALLATGIFAGLALTYVACAPAASEDAPETPLSPAAHPLADATYVGDAACQSCHAEIYGTYQLTNKAASVARFDPAMAPERFDGTVIEDPNSDLRYQAYVEDGSLYQREFIVDDTGRLVHERIHRADYVIGSGNATRSYLMSVDGFLTEMPLTWYVHSERWDLSPGYAEANDRFGRQINLECISCHNGPVDHSAFTQNHYTDMPLGISCERCHGPASEHVAFWEQGGPTESQQPSASAIINPAKLGRSQQESVCQQCHLAGITVFEPGESPLTFRPGQELAANRTVYVPEEQLTDPEWVGIDSHPLRLARSACYEESAMTCSTCHDPHVPAELLEPDHFDQVCQSCHTDVDLSDPAKRPPELAAGQQPATCTRDEHLDALADQPLAEEASCIACHLVRGGTSDVPHVLFTDPWIRRRPGAARDPDEGRSALQQPDPFQLVALQAQDAPAYDLSAKAPATAAAELQAAVAYFSFYETMHGHPAYLPTVIDAARTGLGQGADHVEGRIALARALAERDSMTAAIDVLREAAAVHPGEAWVHFWHGSFLASEGRVAEAIAALQRAVDLQPLFVEAQIQLADAFVRNGQADAAIAQLETLVGLDPTHQPKAWFNLGVLYLQRQQGAAAQQAFEQAVTLDPHFGEALVQLGSMYFSRQAYAEAAQLFQRAIRANPSDPAAYGSLGLIYLQVGEVAQARRLFERVLELDPTNANARALLDQLR